MDASEYKGVVLGLIFLKYISDRFEDKYNQLVADGDGFEEDRDEYTSEGIFFVPAGARWDDIKKKAHDPEIGQVIDDAMRAIEKENVRLKDILPKNFARPELDKRRLGEVVDLFTNIKMIEHGSEKDILGRTYEYCLSMFAEQEGKRGGEFFTLSLIHISVSAVDHTGENAALACPGHAVTLATNLLNLFKHIIVNNALMCIRKDSLIFHGIQMSLFIPDRVSIGLKVDCAASVLQAFQNRTYCSFIPAIRVFRGG